MKKGCLILLLVIAGCAPYQMQKGSPPYDSGYVVSRDGRVIPEYTLGANNTVPDKELADARFKRRRRIVEDYYKKIGEIENRYNETVGNHFRAFTGAVLSVFGTPVRIVDELRYEYDPEYKARKDKEEAEREAQEQARIDKIREELKAYLERDLKLEQEKSTINGEVK